MKVVRRLGNKHAKQKKCKTTAGFALPTILILSIVLLAIGLSLLQLGTAITRSLQDQNWNRLAQVAAQSGVSFIGGCLEANPVAWTAAISPSKDCSGNPAAPARSDYIGTASLGSSSTSSWRSTFSAAPPVTGADGVSRSQIVGKLELLSGGGVVVKTYTYSYNAVLSISASASGPPSSTPPVQAVVGAASGAGDSHSCLVAGNQQVYCTGENDRGNLGTNNTTDSWVLVLFGNAAGSPVIGQTYTQVAVGYRFTCALTTGQDIYCAGDNSIGQLGAASGTGQFNNPVQFGASLNKNFTRVSAGLSHTCGVTTDQIVYCAGNNMSGQLGNNSVTPSFNAPVRFNASPSKNFIEVTAGDGHTCAISTEQLAYCAGENSNGQLGNGGSPTDSRFAVKFGLTGAAVGKTFLQITAGLYSTCGVSTEQLIYCVGSNGSGVLGDGTSINRPATAISFTTGAAAGKKFTAISMSGTSHTCALGTDGLIYCAGVNAQYQLGYSASPANQLDPVLFGGTSPPTIGKAYSYVATGALYTCAVSIENVIYCSGENGNAQQGTGNTTDRTKPDISMMLP